MSALAATLRRNPKALAGFGLVAFFVAVALVGPLLVVDPLEFVGAPHQRPSLAHWAGTTGQGQDVLAQAVVGARTTLSIGFAVGLLVTLFGALVGVGAGYFGGRIDDALSLFTNVFLVIPGLPLAIVLAAYLPPGPGSITFVLVIAGWAWNARVFRAQALSLRQKDFVSAAIVAGESHGRIIAVEILPNMISLLASAFIGATVYAISAQVGLEFLGLGDVGAVTWGTNLYWAANDSALLTGSWWIFVPTGLAVALVGFGLTLINFAIDEVNNRRLAVKDQQKGHAIERPDLASVEPDDALLTVRGLSVLYPEADVCAVDDACFSVRRGEIVGLAGESGSGKSTIGQALLRILAPAARVPRGSLRFDSVEIFDLEGEALRAFRWTRIAMVFQSAMNALNPVLTVRAQLADTLLAHQDLAPAAVRARCEELLRMVDIDPINLDAYPHQLSGGMRQRVVIAIALANDPDLLIMDEPTTALDVVVQKQILQRIDALRRERGFAVLFITHDMPLLLDMADRIAVMRHGKIVEQGKAAELRGGASHAYTRALTNAFPPLERPGPPDGRQEVA